MGFNIEEFDNDESPEEFNSASVAQQIVENAYHGAAVQNSAPEQQYTSDDDHMTEVEKRLEIASYFKLFLSGSIFMDSSPAAVAVEKELRQFVRQRLGVLLNISQEPVKEVVQQFSPEHAEILRAIATKMLSGHTVSSNGKKIVKNEPKAVPQLAKVPAMAHAPEMKLPVRTMPNQNRVAPQAEPTKTHAPAQPPRKGETVAAPVAAPKPRKNSTFRSPHALPMPQGDAMLAVQLASAEKQSRAATGGGFAEQMISAVIKS